MKSILFAFKMGQNNHAAYAKALDMAKQIDAKVTFFTSLKERTDSTENSVYLYLLELFGYYQTNYNNWQVNPIVKTEQIIETGDFETTLKNLLANNKFEWIVPTDAIENSFVVDNESNLFPI